MIIWEVTIGDYKKEMRYDERPFRQLSSINKYSFAAFGKPCATWRFVYQ